MRLLFLVASLLLAAITVAQTQKASGVADFISIDTPVFVLEHVRVIDGTGTPAKEDQAVIIANGKIQFIGPEESAQIPPGAQRMGRSGYTVIPGLVGMHNHLYYTDSYTVQVVDGKVGNLDDFDAGTIYELCRRLFGMISPEDAQSVLIPYVRRLRSSVPPEDKAGFDGTDIRCVTRMGLW